MAIYPPLDTVSRYRRTSLTTKIPATMSSHMVRSKAGPSPVSANVIEYIDRLSAQISARGDGTTSADVNKAFSDLGTISKVMIRVWLSPNHQTLLDR
ncbi:MAG TPA: hypothetical protein VHV10_01090 [Ktedonobacteraceae bacterium]|nr:hypothetical protein [Ktedonobacteraceae bacterium]